MNPQQRSFLESEIWILTFGGAFQRAGLYEKDATEAQRKTFRKHLRDFIEEKVLPQYQNEINENKHLSNIRAIQNFSKAPHGLLRNGKISFGVCQKLLNLLLKYHWCQGWIAEPPHFPVDGIMLRKIKFHLPGGWTKLDEEIKYLEIIAEARHIAKSKSQTPAQWELETFSRN